MEVSREQLLAYRVHAHQLDVASQPTTEPSILDLGVQDTGPDGAGWALVNRGVDAQAVATMPDSLALAWTLRGAPHFYRRSEIAAVAAAVAPVSDADAEKRIFDASRPLREAGIGGLAALDRVAGEMRELVVDEMVKGELSAALADILPPAYLRWCQVCQATHCYEQTFRLSVLRGGLELAPHTSPPLVRRIPRWRGPARRVPKRLEPIRGYLHFFGAATPQQVAKYVDTSVAVVKERWPSDTVEVEVGGERRWVLREDAEALTAQESDPGLVRLLGPFDLLLQCQDRELVVPEEAHRKELWRTIGRPGGILRGAEVVGTWRPRPRGQKLALAIDLWTRTTLKAIDEQGERLAAFRGLSYAGRA
jgi:hypothetical protein